MTFSQLDDFLNKWLACTVLMRDHAAETALHPVGCHLVWCAKQCCPQLKCMWGPSKCHLFVCVSGYNLKNGKWERWHRCQQRFLWKLVVRTAQLSVMSDNVPAQQQWRGQKGIIWIYNASLISPLLAKNIVHAWSEHVLFSCCQHNSDNGHANIRCWPHSDFCVKEIKSWEDVAKIWAWLLLADICKLHLWWQRWWVLSC